MSTDGIVISRRQLLQRGSTGFGLVALQGLLAQGALGETAPQIGRAHV